MFLAIEAHSLVAPEPVHWGGSSPTDAMAFILRLPQPLAWLSIAFNCWAEIPGHAVRIREARLLAREAEGDGCRGLWADAMRWLQEHHRYGEEHC